MNLASNAVDAMHDGGKMVIETENILLDETFCERYMEVEPGEYIQIKFSDNGHGMSRDNALLAIERYATSKITNDEDLFSISSFGFKGIEVIILGQGASTTIQSIPFELMVSLLQHHVKQRR